jgi:hypothetical protein
MAGDEPGSNLSTGDKLIASLLYNFGWMILLVGLELIAQALVMGAQILSYWAEAGVITFGTLLLVASYLWPPSRPETREFFTQILAPLAARSRALIIGALIVLWTALAVQVGLIRSDISVYVLPRAITKDQASDLKNFLEHNTEKPEIEVKVSIADREALEYGSQLFNALNQTQWGTVIFRPTESLPSNDGLCIQEEGTEKKPSQDPKHDPANLIRQALSAADIEVNCGGARGAGDYKLLLIVGHRPVAINQKPPALVRLGAWVMSLGR